MSKPQVEHITSEVFEHLVDLAALALEGAEADYLRAELNAQLSAIAELQGIQVSEQVEITSHGVPYTAAMRPALRDDEIQKAPQADQIVEGSPAHEARYIVVPDIPHEALE